MAKTPESSGRILTPEQRDKIEEMVSKRAYYKEDSKEELDQLRKDLTKSAQDRILNRKRSK